MQTISHLGVRQILHDEALLQIHLRQMDHSADFSRFLVTYGLPSATLILGLLLFALMLRRDTPSTTPV